MRSGPVLVTRLLLLSVLAVLGIGLTAVVGGPAPTDGDGQQVAAPEGGGLVAFGELAERIGLGSGSPGDDVLIWTSGGLPPGFADLVAGFDGVRATSVTRGDRVDLTGSWDVDGEPVTVLEGDWVVPLEGLAVDPQDLARFVPRDVRRPLTGLGDGEALLSETSARVRGLGAGAELAIGGERLAIVGVVPDRYVGAAEVVVDLSTGQRIGIEMERFVLVSYRGDPEALEAAVLAALPPDEPARITPVEVLDHVRQGSGVLPQSHVKQRFGEFALRDLGRRGFEQDPAWVEENIRTERIPLLGRITCHKDYFPAVRGALQELEDRGIGHLVTVRDYGGCWTPRFSGARRSVSRHAWGITADFNISTNPYGAEPNQDPRLVEVMESWGMSWGGRWLVPDAMHFEHVEFPR